MVRHLADIHVTDLWPHYALDVRAHAGEVASEDVGERSIGQFEHEAQGVFVTRRDSGTVQVGGQLLPKNGGSTLNTSTVLITPLGTRSRRDTKRP